MPAPDGGVLIATGGSAITLAADRAEVAPVETPAVASLPPPDPLQAATATAADSTGTKARTREKLITTGATYPDIETARIFWAVLLPLPKQGQFDGHVDALDS
jgi:hypothetical protein